jgi:hypothetical protein
LLHFYESVLEVRSLDEVDNVIWVLPFLLLPGIFSTPYVASQGYSLQLYERGFLSGLFAGAGSAYAYVYAAIYVLIIASIVCSLLGIKNKALEPSQAFDKALFAIVVVTVYICEGLTGTFMTNFLLPRVIDRGISMLMLTVIIYACSVLSLSAYPWRPVLSW